MRRLKIIFVALWAVTILLLYLALTVENDRWSNALSDAFGSSLGAVLVGTIIIGVLVLKKVIR